MLVSLNAFQAQPSWLEYRAALGRLGGGLYTGHELARSAL